MSGLWLDPNGGSLSDDSSRSDWPATAGPIAAGNLPRGSPGNTWPNIGIAGWEFVSRGGVLGTAVAVAGLAALSGLARLGDAAAVSPGAPLAPGAVVVADIGFEFATGVLLNRMDGFPASAVGCAGFAAAPAPAGSDAAAGWGVFRLAAPSEGWVAEPARLESTAGGVAVIVRLAAGCIADLAAGFAGVSDFAVVVQPPADSRGLSSQLEKLAAAP